MHEDPLKWDELRCLGSPGISQGDFSAQTPMLVMHCLPQHLKLPHLSSVPHCCRPAEVMRKKDRGGGVKFLYVESMKAPLMVRVGKVVDIVL